MKVVIMPYPFLVALTLLASLASPGHALEARFIGNAGFELSDGTTTLLIDFPYRSGAFDYMEYPASELHARPGTLCLFTHRHADHFEPALIERIGCLVAGPADVQSAVPEASRAGASPTWRIGDAAITCLPTPHANVEHCSYLIDWAGLRLAISGDVEEVEHLGDLADYDVAFLSSWLLPQIDRNSTEGPRIVVQHHAADEVIPACSRCVVPGQGEAVRLQARGE